MNVLDFQLVDVDVEGLPAGSPPRRMAVWEFMVDGVALAAHLRLRRGELAWINSSLDLPDEAGLLRYTEELLGLAPASNQFGSGRVVLYGCHCGCDYCGVVSARVRRGRDLLFWSELGPEDDEGTVGGLEFSFSIPACEAAVLRFRREQLARRAG